MRMISSEKSATFRDHPFASAVDLLVDLVEHFAAVGAHVGQIAAGKRVDFGDEAVVLPALGDAGASAAHEVVENHSEVPSVPHCCGRLFLPDRYAA
ncbi:hypothetical protein BQ8482_20181 [Mesorhizobium delmotii]|uniref:Uncharacterized protein n=1 Tax=Mesorhizobium delmotii TaxID=1631247 RepID=A0A2P9AK90_9HYPH|nr:hypothetical protein BQ8482_20181 [Mesorhizobium delmotii]